jgi:tetratricopeptide (TPR) repeat protein
MSIRRTSLLALLLVPAHWPSGPLARLGATPLAAQTLARQDLALLQVERGEPRTRQELALGKAALERATTTGDWAAYQEAVRHFEEAALRDPALAEPWFGLALSRLALYESGANALFSPTQPMGVPNRAAWASNLRATLTRDPRHLGALTSIGHVLLPQGERDQPAWVRTALLRAESLGVVTPELTLIRGRLARSEKRYDEAAAAFREYASIGGDPSVAALEEARALAGTGDLDAAAERYEAGLAALTPDGLRLYRRDLALVAEADEWGGLDRLTPATARAWIDRFWLRRDAADVRIEGDRLREHLRRWIVANEFYRVVDPDRRLLFHEPWAPITPCVSNDSFNLLQTGARELADPLDPRRDERILDDRGLMYLRHGDPLRIVWTLGAADSDDRRAEAADREELRRAELPSEVANAEIAFRTRARGYEDGSNTAEVWSYFIDGRLRTYLFRGSRYLGLNAPTTLTSDVSFPVLALLRA